MEKTNPINDFVSLMVKITNNQIDLLNYHNNKLKRAQESIKALREENEILKDDVSKEYDFSIANDICG